MTSLPARLGALLLAAAVALPGCTREKIVVKSPACPAATACGATGTDTARPAETTTPPKATGVDPQVVTTAKAALVARFPEDQARVERGVDQVAALWRAEDGDLAAFVAEHFVPAGAPLDALFARFESQLEQADGYLYQLIRELRWHADVDTGPMLPIDGLFASFDPSAHVTDDLFATKVAFVALLNFQAATLEERFRDGKQYTRRQWAELRLTDRFDRRIPGELSAAASAVDALADQYIADYNLWMHHVLGEDGQRRFPSGKRLISHWNLRDELKANYADADAQAKQRTIVQVMQRIVTQTIPAAVIDNPHLDWNPFSNEVTAAPPDTIEKDAPPTPTPTGERESDVRFQYVLDHFHAARAIDPFSPRAPTELDRAFEEAEMPEDRVRALLVAVLESPHVATVAAEIKERLGRPLEPQDLWYELNTGGTPEAELDRLTRKRYPTAKAFAKDLPRIMRTLGFSKPTATFLAEHIDVDPSRGAGHAMEAKRRGDKPHLRSRVAKGGMDYKGYNIAVHELGHNVEQVFSLYRVDHTLLQGVPNTAFTEALAFLFQARDLELLGRPSRSAAADRLRVLDDFWNTWEIAGSALVELDVWHWLYDHPDATAAQLREATVKIAQDTWARYYAPVLGGQDVALLGIYSHTIASPLYLFNYVLGHLIAFQVEEHLHGKDSKTFAAEFERMCRQGRLTPDVWMEGATGAPVSADALLAATGRALSAK